MCLRGLLQTSMTSPHCVPCPLILLHHIRSFVSPRPRVARLCHSVVLWALTVLLDPLPCTSPPRPKPVSPFSALKRPALDSDLISLLPQHPGTGGNPMALVINYYPFICRLLCLLSVSSHWTLTSGEGGREGEGPPTV